MRHAFRRNIAFQPGRDYRRSASVVLVGYDSDVDLVMRILEAAALQQQRVLREPAPNAALSAFGVDGLEFTVGYWMGDPQNGQLNLHSQVNVAILKALRENGIRIPPPQRAAELSKPSAV